LIAAVRRSVSRGSQDAEEKGNEEYPYNDEGRENGPSYHDSLAKSLFSSLSDRRPRAKINEIWQKQGQRCPVPRGIVEG